MSDQRDLLVTNDAAIADGRELTGAELDELLAQLDQVRLNTKWRELNRVTPLGAWVVATRGAFEGHGRVVNFRRAKPWASDHEIKVAVSATLTVHVEATEVRVVPDPEGAA
ncbi:MAG: hypothetical protein M0026_12330 [Nocardiopsaceae bacterium]|nr:hypothetical protein [Nocardiopsaceae bacterium]